MMENLRKKLEARGLFGYRHGDWIGCISFKERTCWRKLMAKGCHFQVCFALEHASFLKALVKSLG